MPPATYGAFLQDHWVMSRRITLDAGLRYDFERLPRGLPQDPRDLSPRVGIALSPTSRMVIRAGYGIFFDRYLLASLDRVILGNGLQGYEQVAEGFPAASILEASAGASPLVPNAGLLPSVYRADPALATPYSQQASLGWQYSMAKDIVASANYLFVRGVHLARTRNVNLAPPVPEAGVNISALDFTPASGEPVFPDQRITPLLNGIYQLEDSASSTYHGLSFAFRIQKEDFTLDSSYTYSKATDDASSWTEQPQNPYAAQADRGLSLFDLRHRFVLSGLFDLPFGDEDDAAKGVRRGWLTRIFGDIELAPIFTAESGRPENPLTGLDSNGSESYPLSSRPAGYARNSLVLPPLVSLDLRILKAVPMGEGRHLDLVAESFNLLNHTNVTAINPYFGAGVSPAAWFGNPIDALSGRQLQFSIDFEY